MRLAVFVCVLLGFSIAHADPRSDVRALVETWVDAQNAGDFAAYEALYATKLRGVRRSGSRVVHLDRAGWMKDRGRMFEKKMNVVATNIVVHASDTTAEVSFDQAFSQGRYADSGRKTLFVVQEHGAWKIAVEELHDSTLAPHVYAKGSLVGMVDWVGIVLADTKAEWVQKGPATLYDDGPGSALRAIDVSKLPAELRARIGSAVDVVSESGTVCHTTITALRSSRTVIQDFEQEHGVRPSKAQIARLIIDSTDESDDRLVGLVPSGCKEPLIARVANDPAPVAAAKQPTTTEETLALAKMRALPAYRAARALLAKEAPEEAASLKKHEEWPDRSAVHTFDVVVQGKPQHWVSLHVARGDGCGGWTGNVWALWSVDGDRWTLLDEPGSVAIYPQLAVDLDGDGWPELVYSANADSNGLVRGILWRDGATYKRRQELSVKVRVCGC